MMTDLSNKSLQEAILDAFRDYPDFPKPGILFKDICPLLADADLFRKTIQALCAHARSCQATKVIGIESRGFIVGVPTALELGLPFVPARKKGKLPGPLLREEYALEYGTDVVEIQQESISDGDKILVIDDVLATGGTANAVACCVAQSGTSIAGFSFVLELGFLGGRQTLAQAHPHIPIQALLTL